MLAANAPPTRTSPVFSVQVKPRGQDQRARCCGSVQALKTSTRGASKVRRMLSSRCAAGALALFRAFASMCFLLSLQLAKIGIEAFEAVLPVAAIALGPFRHVLERGCLQAGGPGLGLAAAGNEAGSLEHLQMLGDCWLAHVEGPRQLHHAGFPGSEPREDCAARGIGQRGKGLVQSL